MEIKMNFGTDLALERREISNTGKNDGVTVKKYAAKNAEITEIEIVSEKGAEKIGKPKGRYITVEVPPFTCDSELLDGRADAVRDALKRLLPQKGAVLVAGLGNQDITPDALGPKAARGIFSTRHISEELSSSLGFYNLRQVSSVAFGVLGQTGIESAEIIKGVVKAIAPAAVITVDALAARSAERLGSTVQMTDTGIFPGSGVGNHRAEISERTVGVPVISIGVPTVIDASVLADEFAIGGVSEKNRARAEKLMVTPREIDVLILRASRLVSLAVNCALQPEISPEELLSLTA